MSLETSHSLIEFVGLTDIVGLLWEPGLIEFVRLRTVGFLLPLVLVACDAY